MAANRIHITTRITADIRKVWDAYLVAEPFIQFDKQSREWYCPEVQNDFQIGGKFMYHFMNQDKSFSFVFSGVYTEIILYKKISFEFDKKRQATYIFKDLDGHTEVNIYIDSDGIHSDEIQIAGWTSVINSFKSYVEEL